LSNVFFDVDRKCGMDGPEILIVEDEVIVAKDLESRLQKLGYKVCCIVNSGELAVEKAFQLKPDIILMDIFLK
jgi:two-component system, response regulator PdtaR